MFFLGLLDFFDIVQQLVCVQILQRFCLTLQSFNFLLLALYVVNKLADHLLGLFVRLLLIVDFSMEFFEIVSRVETHL